MTYSSPISNRAYFRETRADSWREIWEAGPYYDRVAAALETAQRYAIFVGWQIDSRLPMPGPSGRVETLREKILRICERKPEFHFYFLIWDHAYFYVLERERWQGRIWDELHPRVHFIFDNRHPFGGSHHEKICILDGERALTGGIDLCGDRWDSPEHLYRDPRRSLDLREESHGPYHDLAVEVTGPVCGELQRHVGERWRAISSIPFPDPPPPGPPSGDGFPVLFSRTLSRIDRMLEGKRAPPIVREIEFLFRDLIRGAKRRVILEGQYYWSREINDFLIAKMHSEARKPREQPFEIYLILADLTRTRSLTRLMAPYELGLLEQLEQAARATGTRLTMGSPYVHGPADRPGATPRPIYIHSKLLIVDDRHLCVGSANFASRALRIDTEVSLTLEARSFAQRAHIRAAGDRVLAHWNIAPASSAPAGNAAVRLHRFHPRFDLARNRERGRWTRLPFQKAFDPQLPPTYPFKRIYRRLEHRRSWIRIASLVCLSALGTAASWVGALAFGAERGAWPIAYVLLLSSSWWLPVPFLPIAALLALQFGAASAAKIFLPSLWAASLIGYALARAYPTAATRYYNRIGPRWLPERLGRRSFGTLVSVLSDPRVELRSKIAYQGIYCVPLPWFALGTWVVLPAAIDMTCRVTELAFPAAWSASVRSQPLRWIASLFALTAARAAIRMILAWLRPAGPTFANSLNAAREDPNAEREKSA